MPASQRRFALSTSLSLQMSAQLNLRGASPGTVKLLELILWVNDGVVSRGVVLFLCRQMIDMEESGEGEGGEDVLGGGHILADHHEVRRRDVSLVLMRLLVLAEPELAKDAVQFLHKIVGHSPASVALIGAAHPWECIPDVVPPGYPSEDVFHLLCDVSLQSIDHSQMNNIFHQLLFTQSSAQLLQYLLFCKRVLVANAKTPHTPIERSVQHFFSFNGRDHSGLSSMVPRAFPDKGFTFSCYIFPHSLVNEPRLFAMCSVTTSYCECYVKSKTIGIMTRKGESVHRVEIPTPQLQAKVWTKVTITLTYRRVYSSFATVYINEKEAGHANIKYPVIKNGERAVIRLMSLALRRNCFCGLTSRICVLREPLADIVDVSSKQESEVEVFLRGEGSTSSGFNATHGGVWCLFSPEQVTRRKIIDCALNASEQRGYCNVERTHDVTCHSLHPPLNIIKKSGGAPVFVFLLKKLSNSFHSIYKKTSKKDTAELCESVTLIRDCIVTTIEVICELYISEGGSGGEDAVAKGFSLISLVLRALPRELLPLHVVKIFVNLIVPSSSRTPTAVITQSVLKCVLFGASGAAIWLRSPFESQKTVLEKVSDCIAHKCYLGFQDARRFCRWFEHSVISVPELVETVLPMYYHDSQASDLLTKKEVCFLKRMVLGIIDDLTKFGGSRQSHAESVLYSIEKVGVRGGESSDEKVEDLLKVVLLMLERERKSVQSGLQSVIQKNVNRFTPMLAAYWGHPSNSMKMLSVKIYVAMQGKIETIFSSSQTQYYVPVLQIMEGCGFPTDERVFTALKEAAIGAVSASAETHDAVEWQRIANTSILPAMLLPITSSLLSMDRRKILAKDVVVGLENDRAAALKFLEIFPLFPLIDKLKQHLDANSVLCILSALLKPCLTVSIGVESIRDVWCISQNLLKKKACRRPAGNSAVAGVVAVLVCAELQGPSSDSDTEETEEDGTPDTTQYDVLENTSDPPNLFVLRLFSLVIPEVSELLRTIHSSDGAALGSVVLSYSEMVFIVHKLVTGAGEVLGEEIVTRCIASCLQVFLIAHRRKLKLVDSRGFVGMGEATHDEDDDEGFEDVVVTPGGDDSTHFPPSLIDSHFSKESDRRDDCADLLLRSTNPEGRKGGEEEVEPHPHFSRSPLIYRLLLSLALQEFSMLLARYHGEEDTPSETTKVSSQEREFYSKNKRDYLRLLASRLQGGAKHFFHSELSAYLNTKVLELHGRQDRDAARASELCDTILLLVGVVVSNQVDIFDNVQTDIAPTSLHTAVKIPVVIPLFHLGVITRTDRTMMDTAAPLLPGPPQSPNAGGKSLRAIVSRLIENVFLHHPDAVSKIQDVTGATWMTLDTGKWEPALTRFLKVRAAEFHSNPLMCYKLKERGAWRVSRLQRKSELVFEKKREVLDTFLQELGLLRGSPGFDKTHEKTFTSTSKPEDRTAILHSEWVDMEEAVLDSLVLLWWGTSRFSRAIPLLSTTDNNNNNSNNSTNSTKHERIHWKLDLTGYRFRLIRFKPIGVHAGEGDFRRQREETENTTHASSADLMRMSLPRKSIEDQDAADDFEEPDPIEAGVIGEEEEDEKVDDVDDQEDQESSMGRMNTPLEVEIGGAEAAAEGVSQKVTQISQHLKRLKQTIRAKAWKLTTAGTLVEGDLYRTDDQLIFFSDKSKEVEAGGSHDVVISIASVLAVYQRRCFLQKNALEFLVESDAVASGSHFFKFSDQGIRDSFISVLTKPKNRAAMTVTASITRGPSLTCRTPAEAVKKYKITERWVKNQISNYEYLMELNFLAGRSFNDINQYPVFPWVLSDYTSDTIDLSDPSCYRDFSKPVGALNPQRLEGFLERYKQMQDADDMDAFLYGSHYSYGGAVLFYLARVEPFSTMLLKMQGGKWDVPDRMFLSVEGAWRGVLEGPTDVKELTPEFFTTPEFLLNRNRLQFGKLHSGEDLDDVKLPPWAGGSAYRFIHMNRQALESQYVSSCLHKWIDLIFGHKQKGPAAVQANNLFYYLTYEGAVDWAKVDIQQRESYQSQIQAFGQTPSQLFTKPHPMRHLNSNESVATSAAALHQQAVLVDLGGSVQRESTATSFESEEQTEWTVVNGSGSSNKVLAVSRVELGSAVGGRRPSVLTSLVLTSQSEDEKLTPLGTSGCTGGSGSPLIDDTVAEGAGGSGTVFCVTSALNFYNVKLDFGSLKLTNKEGLLAAAAGTVGGLVSAGGIVAGGSPSNASAGGTSANSNGLLQTLSALKLWSPWNHTDEEATAGDSTFDMADSRFHASHRLSHSKGGKVYIAGAWDGKIRVVHTKRPTVLLDSFSVKAKLVEAQAGEDNLGVPDLFDPGLATCVSCSEPFLCVGTSLGLVVVFALSERGEKRVASSAHNVKLTRLIRGHTGFVTAVAANQKLDTVVSGSSCGDILVHSVRSGALLRVLPPPEGTTNIRRLLITFAPPHTAFPLISALCDIPNATQCGISQPPFTCLKSESVIRGLQEGEGMVQTAVVFSINGEVLVSHEALTGSTRDSVALKVRDIALLVHPVPLLCLVGGEEDHVNGFARFVEIFRGGVVVGDHDSHIHLPCGETFASCTQLPDQCGDGAAVLGTLSGSLFVLCVDRSLRPESQWPFKIQSSVCRGGGLKKKMKKLKTKKIKTDSARIRGRMARNTRLEAMKTR